MVKIIINNIHSKIVGFLEPEVHVDLDRALSYRLKNARHIPSVKKGHWDGVFHLYMKSRGQSFYTGLLSFAREILTKHNVEFSIEDRRVCPEQDLPHLTFDPPEKWGYEERDYQTFTIERALKFTRGLLSVCTGGGKCLGTGTKVLMFNGSTKSVEDIKTGDLLMGPDSTSRTVDAITQGHGELYSVKQNNGDDFVCNDEHILCLQNTRKNTGHKEVQITASGYYKSNKRFKHHYKGYKVGVDFKSVPTPIDPYWLGLWLGDGNSDGPAITTGDKEIVDYLYKYAEDNKLYITPAEGRGCKTYSFVKTPRSNVSKECSRDKCDRKSNSGGMCRRHYREYLKDNEGVGVGRIFNPLKNALKDIGVFNNKHIPSHYKFNDRASRLKLLAGLIDSDGNFAKVGSVEFCNSNKRLAEDVCWLARSLGFRSSLNKKKTSIRSTGYKGIAYRVRVSGKISNIPVLLRRKQAGDKTKYLDVRYGIKVKPIGQGDYFGFEIDGDRKFLLGDFTVTHNTVMVTKIISEIKTSPFIFYVLTKDLMEQAYRTLSICLNEPIGRIGDGMCDIKKINVCTIQTAMRALKGKTKLKISDYKFDEEDKWDEKKIESQDKLDQINNLIKGAKGIYFDEVHHAAAKTCKEVLEASTEAYWKFGGSATPYREDGDEIMIQAMFGAKIVDISASYLIKKGVLVKPYIFMVPVNSAVDLHSYPKIYKHCIVENSELNDSVAKTVNHLVSRGLSSLVLVQRYPHGDYLKLRINDAEFVTGRMTTKKRTQSIDDLRDGISKAMIATSLADEGLDVPTLDSALLPGGGASATRVNQRIGRTLRKDKEGRKDKAIVIIYEHNARFLDKHAKKVRGILKRESEFEIINSQGLDFICDEIDNLLGFDTEPTSLFEV